MAQGAVLYCTDRLTFRSTAPLACIVVFLCQHVSTVLAMLTQAHRPDVRTGGDGDWVELTGLLPVYMHV